MSQIKDTLEVFLKMLGPQKVADEGRRKEGTVQLMDQIKDTRETFLKMFAQQKVDDEQRCKQRQEDQETLVKQREFFNKIIQSLQTSKVSKNVLQVLMEKNKRNRWPPVSSTNKTNKQLASLLEEHLQKTADRIKEVREPLPKNI